MELPLFSAHLSGAQHGCGAHVHLCQSSPSAPCLSRDDVMNVSLTKELEQLVNAKVKSGRYLSASEVVREALRLLEDRDRLQELHREELRRDIQKGLKSGPPIAADEVFHELREKARKKRRRKAG
jgi:antitoxin ParD1/3/4